MIKEVRGFTPEISEDVFVAPNATIIGDVKIAAKSSILFGTVIRGDVNSIRIGKESNIQDLCMIHATYKKTKTIIGDRVSVGHSCVLHGCEIGDQTLIGMGSILMDNVKVGKQCLVAAGSLLSQGKEFPEGHLIMGRPAKAVRKLTEEEIQSLDKSADNYLLYKTWYEED